MIQITSNTDSNGKLYFNVTVRKGEQEIYKVLNYEALCKFLQSSYREAEIPAIAVGAVPQGYLDSKVSPNNTGTVRILCMGQKRPFYQAVMNRKIPKEWEIVYPSMIFEIEYGPGRVPRGRAFCVKGAEEEIRKAYYSDKGVKPFRYPFGNISSDGHMCMGNIRTQVPSMADVDVFLEAFWTGVTNTDYLQGEKVAAKADMTQTELLMNCSEGFPEEILMPANVGNLKRF